MIKPDRRGDDLSLAPDDSLQIERISWDEWFRDFDDGDLLFVFDRHGYGCKVVRRSSIEQSTVTPDETSGGLAWHLRDWLRSLWRGWPHRVHTSR